MCGMYPSKKRIATSFWWAAAYEDKIFACAGQLPAPRGAFLGLVTYTGSRLGSSILVIDTIGGIECETQRCTIFHL